MSETKTISKPEVKRLNGEGIPPFLKTNLSSEQVYDIKESLDYIFSKEWSEAQIQISNGGQYFLVVDGKEVFYSSTYEQPFQKSWAYDGFVMWNLNWQQVCKEIGQDELKRLKKAGKDKTLIVYPIINNEMKKKNKTQTNIEHLNERLTAGMTEEKKQEYLNTKDAIIKEATKDGGFSINLFDAMKIIAANKTTTK